MLPGVLYTYLTYITEQIWLPHRSHSHYAKLANKLNISAYISKHNQLQCQLYMLLSNKGKKQICPQNWAYVPNIFISTNGRCIWIYALHIKSLTPII